MLSGRWQLGSISGAQAVEQPSRRTSTYRWRADAKTYRSGLWNTFLCLLAGLICGAQRLDRDVESRFEITEVASGQHDADAALHARQQRGGDLVRVEPGSDLVLRLHMAHAGCDLVVPLAHQGRRDCLSARCAAADLGHQHGERAVLPLPAV